MAASEFGPFEPRRPAPTILFVGVKRKLSRQGQNDANDPKTDIRLAPGVVAGINSNPAPFSGGFSESAAVACFR
jgi:hypothetical protein